MKFSFEGTAEEFEGLINLMAGGELVQSGRSPYPFPSPAPYDSSETGGTVAAGGLRGPPGIDESTPPLPPPKGRITVENFDFGKLSLKKEGWDAFQSLVELWLQNFDGPVDDGGKPLTPQPERLDALKAAGSSRWSIYILRWIAFHRSLQKAVLVALSQLGMAPEPFDKKSIDLAAKVASNMVQVSHMGFPDLEGFYDHSTKWMRDLE